MEDARRCDRKPIVNLGYYALSADANWSTFDLTQLHAVAIPNHASGGANGRGSRIIGPRSIRKR
jgi:hypothetical protein